MAHTNRCESRRYIVRDGATPEDRDRTKTKRVQGFCLLSLGLRHIDLAQSFQILRGESMHLIQLTITDFDCPIGVGN